MNARLLADALRSLAAAIEAPPDEGSSPLRLPTPPARRTRHVPPPVEEPVGEREAAAARGKLRAVPEGRRP